MKTFYEIKNRLSMDGVRENLEEKTMVMAKPQRSDACLKATDWCRADYEYFRGGGFSSHFKTEAEMPITMLRVNLIEGIGPVIQIAEGYTCVLPDEIHEKLDKRTDPTWPTTWFAPILTGKGAFKDVYSLWQTGEQITV